MKGGAMKGLPSRGLHVGEGCHEGTSPSISQQVGGMHPTGMHSFCCCCCCLQSMRDGAQTELYFALKTKLRN